MFKKSTDPRATKAKIKNTGHFINTAFYINTAKYTSLNQESVRQKIKILFWAEIY